MFFLVLSICKFLIFLSLNCIAISLQNIKYPKLNSLYKWNILINILRIKFSNFCVISACEELHSIFKGILNCYFFSFIGIMFQTLLLDWPSDLAVDGYR